MGLSPPAARWNHSQASGLMGSPTLPRMRKRRQIIFLRPILAVAHQEANGGRCRVKNRDTIALDQIPPTAWRWVVRFPFGGENRRAVQQRTIDDVTVPGDPAGIGDAEVDIVVFQVKDVLRGDICAHHVTAMDVEDAFRFSCRAGRVEDIEWCFGIQGFGFTDGRFVLQPLFPIDFFGSGQRGPGICRRTTTTCSTVGQFVNALSTIGFKLMILPRSNPTSAVMTSLASASLMRLAKAGALKPE